MMVSSNGPLVHSAKAWCKQYCSCLCLSTQNHPRVSNLDAIETLYGMPPSRETYKMDHTDRP